MSVKRLAVFLTAASLSLAGVFASAGAAQASSAWRTLKFTHGKNICLSLQSKASTAKGKRTQIQKCNNGVSQLWRIDRSDYKGTNVGVFHPGSDTSKCLDGAKTEKLGSGWHIHAVKCNGSTTQKWKYVLSSSGSYFTGQNYKTNLCIDAYKKGTKAGTWVGTAKCTSKAGQIILVV